MGSYTTFSSQNLVHQRLNRTIDDLDSVYSKINSVLHEDLYPLQKDSYHFIGKMLKQLTASDRKSFAFANTLFKSVYRSEVTSAGSGHFAFLFGLAFAKQLLRTQSLEQNEAVAYKELERTLEYLKSQLRASVRVADPTDVRRMIGVCCDSDPVLAEAIWEALQLAGLEGKIFIENGRQSNFIVELKEGYNFDLKPFPYLLKANSWNAYDCKMLVVDGLVEKVSEIDHLLMENFKTKQAMCIIAHGFSEEVVATLKANQDRGTLDIQPVRIPPDVGSLNVANDIAVVCGGTPISAMKGDLLTFVKYDEMPVVDVVRLTDHLCVIENAKSRAAVSDQIRYILEKRQSYFLHEEVQELFDKRMHSLVSNAVNIHLPEAPMNKLDEQRIKIDLSLRMAKTVLDHGIVQFPKVVQELLAKPMTGTGEVGRCFRAAIAETAERVDANKNTSTLSALIGCDLAAREVLMFLTASGMVEITS